jgi:hypothetical protein
MKKEYFNKKARKTAKVNLKKRKQLSKRMGGVRGISIVVENRNTSATKNDNSPKNNKL